MTNEQIDKIVDHATAIVELAQTVDPRVTDESFRAPVDVQYREDGFSVETSEWGGRRHKLVDDAIDALYDAGLGDIAEEADAYFNFPEEVAPDLQPETKEKQDCARYSVDRNFSAWVQNDKDSPYHAPYKAKLDSPDLAQNRTFELIDGHATVFLPQKWTWGLGWTQVTPVQAMERYARLLSRHIG